MRVTLTICPDSRNTATVLILRGSLTPSSHIISGTTHAKVRHLTNSTGTHVRIAHPGDAVIVSGWKELPQSGDDVLQGKEEDIKKAVQNRIRRVELHATLSDVEAINVQRRAERERRDTLNPVDEESANGSQSGPKQLRLIIKADVSGSAEALVETCEGIGNKLVATKVVTSGVGSVTESDVAMAKTVDGMPIVSHDGTPFGPIQLR